MLLIIHNFSYNTRLSEIRKLITDKCGLSNVVLDNFTNEGKTKRITVGLADEVDAALVARKLNGFLYNGMQLYVEDIRQKPPEKSNRAPPPPIRPLMDAVPTTSNTSERSQYGQTQADTPIYQQPQFQQNPMPVSPDMSYPRMPSNPYQMTYSNMPFYMTPLQNTYNCEAGASGGANIQYPDCGQYNPPSQWPPQPTEMYQCQPHLNNECAPQNANHQNSKEEQLASTSTSRTRWDNNKAKVVDREDSKKRNISNERGHDYDYDYNYESGYNERSERSNWNKAQDKSKYSLKRKPDDYQYDDISYKDANIDGCKRRKENEHQEPIYNKQDTFRSNRLDRSSTYDRYPDRRSHEYPSHRDNSGRNTKPGSEYNAYNSRSETVSRPYANNPRNSTFNNSTGFGHVTKYNNRSNYEEKLRNLNQKSSNFGKNKNASNFFSQTNDNYVNEHPNSKFNESSIKAQKKQIRHTNWRFQASSIIAKQVLKNANKLHCKGNVQIALKASIVARIDSVMGRSIASNLKDLIEMYRNRFAPEEDPVFYAAVLQKANHAKKGKVSAMNAVPINPQEKIILAPPPAYKPASDVIPKYPNADKKLASQQRQKRFLELQDDFVYHLEPSLRKALDEEIQLMSDVFTNACFFSNDIITEKVEAAIKNEALTKFRKIMDLHLTKRLLNYCDSIQLRVLFSPKAPPTEMLADFLKNYEITSLKKSEKKKMFIVTCSNFEGFDGLCALRSTVLGSSTLQFKPLQITGVPEHKLKAKEKKFRARLQNARNIEAVVGTHTVNVHQGNVTGGDGRVHQHNVTKDNRNVHLATAKGGDRKERDKDDVVPNSPVGGKDKCDEDSDVVLVVPSSSENDIIIIDDCEYKINKKEENSTERSLEKDNGDENDTTTDNSAQLKQVESIADDWELNGADPGENWDHENPEQDVPGNAGNEESMAPLGDGIDFTEDDLEDF